VEIESPQKREDQEMHIRKQRSRKSLTQEGQHTPISCVSFNFGNILNPAGVELRVAPREPEERSYIVTLSEKDVRQIIAAWSEYENFPT
jgi:hypothetical protein